MWNRIDQSVNKNEIIQCYDIFPCMQDSQHRHPVKHAEMSFLCQETRHKIFTTQLCQWRLGDWWWKCSHHQTLILINGIFFCAKISCACKISFMKNMRPLFNPWCDFSTDKCTDKCTDKYISLLGVNICATPVSLPTLTPYAHSCGVVTYCMIKLNYMYVIHVLAPYSYC